MSPLKWFSSPFPKESTQVLALADSTDGTTHCSNGSAAMEVELYQSRGTAPRARPAVGPVAVIWVSLLY
jgi:hypothetical protein